MKIGFALAALTLGTLATLTVSDSVVAEESLEGKMAITATRDTKTNELTLLIKGKDATVYVNTEYDLKCTLAIESGGALGKTELRKADAKFEDAGKPGKAKSATLKTSANKIVSGDCKIVACTDNSCSSPFKVAFKSN